MHTSRLYKSFAEYLAEEYDAGALVIFDIDDTLFRTSAKIKILNKDTDEHRYISSADYNTYQLKPNEEYNYDEFRDSKKFAYESKPIHKMLNKAKILLGLVLRNPKSKMVVITARENFDDKKLVLDTLNKHGIDTKHVRIERAGNIKDIDTSIAFKKNIIIRNYIKANNYYNVKLFDDSMNNIKEFLKLKSEFPHIKFEGFLAKENGDINIIR